MENLQRCRNANDNNGFGNIVGFKVLSDSDAIEDQLLEREQKEEGKRYIYMEKRIKSLGKHLKYHRSH